MNEKTVTQKTVSDARPLPLIDEVPTDLNTAPQKATPKRSRRVDYDGVPFQDDVFGHIPNPENIAGIGRKEVYHVHRWMFNHYMADLRNAQVCKERRRSVWEWILDTFSRWDDEPVAAGTFRACCRVMDMNTLDMIKALAWQRRRELDWLFGHGTHLKVYRRADMLQGPDENHLCEEMGARRAPEGCYRGSVPGGAL